MGKLKLVGTRLEDQMITGSNPSLDTIAILSSRHNELPHYFFLMERVNWVILAQLV
jgi:hypothetical protein